MKEAIVGESIPEGGTFSVKIRKNVHHALEYTSHLGMFISNFGLATHLIKIAIDLGMLMWSGIVSVGNIILMEFEELITIAYNRWKSHVQENSKIRTLGSLATIGLAIPALLISAGLIASGLISLPLLLIGIGAVSIIKEAGIAYETEKKLITGKNEIKKLKSNLLKKIKQETEANKITEISIHQREYKILTNSQKEISKTIMEKEAKEYYLNIQNVQKAHVIIDASQQKRAATSLLFLGAILLGLSVLCPILSVFGVVALAGYGITLNKIITGEKKRLKEIEKTYPIPNDALEQFKQDHGHELINLNDQKSRLAKQLEMNEMARQKARQEEISAEKNRMEIKKRIEISQKRHKSELTKIQIEKEKLAHQKERSIEIMQSRLGHHSQGIFHTAPKNGIVYSSYSLLN